MSPLKKAIAIIRLNVELNARLVKYGIKSYRNLVEIETACANSGLILDIIKPLNYPWMLPISILQDGDGMSLKHPAIDPDYARQQFPELNTSDKILRLISSANTCLDQETIPKLNPGEARSRATKIAIYIHLYYPDIWPIIRSHLEQIPEPWHLYISAPTFICSPTIKHIINEFPETRVFAVDNSGRDIKPFLKIIKSGVLGQYDAVCKLHTKKSPHSSRGNKWLNDTLTALVGNENTIFNIISRFRSSGAIGMIGPKDFLIDQNHKLYNTMNSASIKQVRSWLNLPSSAHHPFFAGTMFWFNPKAMTLPDDLEVEALPFPIEHGQADGTIAHAFERLLPAYVANQGYSVECATLTS
jgi:lipopolysaccharide biosynthesis protein